MPRKAKEIVPKPRPRKAPSGKREKPAARPTPDLVEELLATPGRVPPRLENRVIWDHVYDHFLGTATATITACATAIQRTITNATATTGSIFDMPDAWTQWVITHNNATSSATTTAAWPNWVRGCDAEWTANRRYIQEYERIQARGRVSPEERARREAQQRVYEEERQQRRLAREVANHRAEKLLRSVLTPDQIRDLESKHHFFMLDKHGRRYRVDRGQHGNVKLVDERDQVVESYCIQPQGGLPDADAMAAQVCMLASDPETFRSVANVSDARGQILRWGGRDIPAPALPQLPVPELPRIQLPVPELPRVQL